MRVAGATARAQGDRRDTERDRDVGVGRGAGELVLVAHRPRRSDGGLHQRVTARCQP